MAGGDVAAFAANSAEVVDALLEALNPAILALRASAAPVLAIVQGPAAGAGLSLVLGADIVLAGEGARFLVAYDQIGAPADCGATWPRAEEIAARIASGPTQTYGQVKRLLDSAMATTLADHLEAERSAFLHPPLPPSVEGVGPR